MKRRARAQRLVFSVAADSLLPSGIMCSPVPLLLILLLAAGTLDRAVGADASTDGTSGPNGTTTTHGLKAVHPGHGHNSLTPKVVTALMITFCTGMFLCLIGALVFAACRHKSDAASDVHPGPKYPDPVHAVVTKSPPVAEHGAKAKSPPPLPPPQQLEPVVHAVVPRTKSPTGSRKTSAPTRTKSTGSSGSGQMHGSGASAST